MFCEVWVGGVAEGDGLGEGRERGGWSRRDGDSECSGGAQNNPCSALLLHRSGGGEGGVGVPEILSDVECVFREVVEEVELRRDGGDARV